MPPFESHTIEPPRLGPRRDELCALSLNHRRATVALRERFALSRDDCAALVRRLLGGAVAREALVLSTCNRTEIYACGDRGALADSLRRVFEELAGPEGHLPLPLELHEGEAAARHLFAVAAGLDSQILGENQIKQQVRDAVDVSRRAGGLGRELNRLVEAVFRASKRIRTETGLNAGTLSIGRAAILKAEAVLGTLAGKVCVVIGAGKIAGLAARALAERRPARLCIVNRTPDNAAALARETRAEAHGLDALAPLLAEADFVLGAAWAPEFILRADAWPAAPPARPRCLVDAAVPRVLDPDLARRPGVTLLDLDHLDDLIAENRARRAGAARDAQAVIEQELARWRVARAHARLAPAFNDLRARFERAWQAECAVAGDDPRRRLRDRRRLLLRELHRAIERLKAQALD